MGGEYMNKYMKTAIDLSNRNLRTHDGGPFGACVVKDGKIIGRGSNHVIKNNDPTAHAEIMAIRDACAKTGSCNLSDCELYTSCYPCPMCLGAIMWANIKRVYYANTTQDAHDIGFKDGFIYEYLYALAKGKPDNKTVKFKSLNRKEANAIFKAYVKQKNKVTY